MGRRRGGRLQLLFRHHAPVARVGLQRQWRVGLLVDEAHNLVDRACAMYSASLRLPTLRAARAGATPALRRTLDAVLRAGATRLAAKAGLAGLRHAARQAAHYTAGGQCYAG